MHCVMCRTSSHSITVMTFRLSASTFVFTWGSVWDQFLVHDHAAIDQLLISCLSYHRLSLMVPLLINEEKWHIYTGMLCDKPVSKFTIPED